MGDVITQWLREKLGVIVDVHDESFLQTVLNGHLIALLLYQYNIINEDQLKSLQDTQDDKTNTDRVTSWLKKLDPSLEEDANNCFTKNKLSAAVKLFYKLYVVLKGKDQLHFTAQNAIREKLPSINSKFERTRLPDEKGDIHISIPNPLSQPLQDYDYVIEWHRERYKTLFERCKEARNAYACYIQKKEKIKSPDFTFRNRSRSISQNLMRESLQKEDSFEVLSLNESYDQLKEQEKTAREIQLTEPNSQLAQKIVKKLKKKYKQEQEERAMKAQMETIMVTKIWNETVRQQEEAIEMELSKKILKQSNYEKQMANKIFEIREQKRIMAENRILVQKEILKQMDNSLLEYVFLKEKESGDERYRYYLERDRILELHKRIYEERQRLMKERRLKMCTDIVTDIIDMSLKEAEYKEAFNEEMSPKLKKDLADLFIEGKSIFDVVDDVENIIDYVPDGEFDDEIFLEEIDRQNTIDKRNFEDYCNFVWPYEIEVHAKEFLDDLEEIQLAMNILGHVIFRLLLTKYPKPPLPTPPDIPKVEAAVCVTNIPDQTVIPILQKLLIERKIQVIQLEEAINYCLAAYKDEITTEAPESQFVDETQQALEQVKKKKDKNKKRKENPPPKGQKPKGKQKNKESVAPTEEIPPFKDEMIQTPRVFPCEEIKMSEKAILGKAGYEVLNLGEPLSDEIVVKMFVEYLKTLKDIYGWVLINYPQNFNQAVLLEEALTAKKVPIAQSLKLEEQNLNQKENEETKVIYDSSIMKTSFSCDEQIKTKSTSKSMTFADLNENLNDNLNDNLTDITEETTHTPVDTPLDLERFVVVPEKKPSSKLTQRSISFLTDQDKETIKTQSELKLEDFVDVSTRYVEQNSISLDKNAKFRISLLLTNPDVVKDEIDYDSYLTALIKLQQDVESLPNPHIIDMDEDLNVLTQLDVFYQNQGCHYTLYYKTLDFSAVKHLGKLIVGEYTIPPKTSVQIFGDTVLYLEADVLQPDAVNESLSKKKGKKAEKKEKKEKSVKSKSETGDGDKGKGKKGKDKKSEEKKSKKDKKSDGGKGDGKKGKGKGKIAAEAEVAIERADKEVQVPTPAPESVIEIVEMVEPIPGTKEYIYVDLPIDDSFQISLATLWENVEEVYVYDFRELFFRRRLTWRTVVPYMDFVRRYLRDFIARPDEKQVHVFNFQKIYNSIDEDLRNDDEMKAELHCRIHEFREKLWEICDQRMQEAEQERNNIILQDWLAKQACELTNIYITAMQLEIDRCADTIQLLNDYYTIMVTKVPNQSDIIDKALLNQVCLTAYMDFEEAMNYKLFVRTMLTDCNFILEETPYHKTIKNDFQSALLKAQMYEDNSLKEIHKVEGSIQPKKDKSKEKNKKSGKTPLNFTDPSPEIREQAPKLIKEWTAVIKGEKLRTYLRLNMLMSLFNEDITDMFNSGINTFHGLYNDIKIRYEKEIQSVEICCGVISRAVEEEIPIQPQLVLKGPDFYIDPNVMLFEEPLPMSSEIIKEYEQAETFTIDQLEKLITVMMHYAPRGVVPEQAFLFVLQDMIVYIPEDGGIAAVPELWGKLSYKSMNRLCYEFFGNVEKVDWRDFVLYNLCISFPSEIEMMDMRRQFRELDEDRKEFVYEYQYDSVRFWFEKEFDKTNPQDLDRFIKIKKILFKMYALSEETVNYTALLLGFCKGSTTIEGVAKALGLSLGKLVCHQKDIGEAFLETLRERKRQQIEEELQFQLEEKEKTDIVTSIIESLVDTTVHECDSCYLTEITDGNQGNTPSEPQSEDNEPNVGFISESMEYLDRLMKRYGPVDAFEGEYYGGFLHEEFSNVEIGYEVYKNPPLVYYLLYDVIYTVLMASMPWQASVQNVGEITFREKLENVYEELKNHEFDDIVLMHEFLNSIQFEELMETINKFKIINPRIVIRSLLSEDDV